MNNELKINNNNSIDKFWILVVKVIVGRPKPIKSMHICIF